MSSLLQQVAKDVDNSPFMSAVLQQVSNWLWGVLLVVLLGGGLYFTVYSRLAPLRYLRHAVGLLLGRHDDPSAPGEVSHFRALCTALSGTVGMGNVAGVAVALTKGGPGALFWMWICALLGMVTKFFTCTLAVRYRGRDESGRFLGGPMYVITEGLGPRWRPLAVFFCGCGLFGCLPLLQSNQLTGIVRHMFFEPAGFFTGDAYLVTLGNGLFGFALAGLVGLVVVGGVVRIGAVAARLVPIMVVLYGGSALVILACHASEVPGAFALVFQDAFTGEAVAGGALGVVIMTGVRRAAFSNEAGMGTEAMAHGVARTREPAREGLVAMLGPVVDTLIVCTLTGLVLLVTGVTLDSEAEGILLTTQAFSLGFPGLPDLGPALLLLSVLCLSFSSMLGYSYYVLRCGTFLFGDQARAALLRFYLLAIVVSAVVEMSVAINFLDIAFGLMAVPTMLSTLLLAPKAMESAREYFNKLRDEG